MMRLHLAIAMLCVTCVADLQAIQAQETTVASPADTVKSQGQLLIDQARALRAGVPPDSRYPLVVPDLPGARAALEAAAALPGSHQAAAQVSLAKMLLNGDGGQVDEARGVELLDRARSAGSAEAAYELGQFWLGQAGKEADGESSLKLALQLGYVTAGLALAEWYSKSDPEQVQPMVEFATTLLTTQAAAGDSSAAFVLADYFRKLPAGDGKTEEALKWYEAAASLGNARAFYWLGRLQSDRELGQFNAAAAIDNYVSAANAGSVEAARRLILPEAETGLAVPDTVSSQWMTALLAINDASAQLINLNKMQASLDARTEIATELYDDLMAEDVPSIDDLVSLGSRFRDGDGVVADRERALALFERGAKRGSKDGILRYAELLLALPGLQTSDNTGFAINALKQIADEGSIGGSVMLGNYYRYGIGTPQDLDLAVEAYVRAAESGQSVDAMMSLAALYTSNADVSVRQKAFAWLQKAANLGSGGAQVKLAEAYAVGDIVPRDQLRSVQWYQRAIDAGDGSALASLVKTFMQIKTPAALRLATDALERAVQQNYPDAPVLYANFLVDAGNATAAVPLLERPEYAKRTDVALALTRLYADKTLALHSEAKAKKWLDVAVANMGEAPKERVSVAAAMLASGDADMQSGAVAILIEMTEARVAEAARYLGRAYLAGTGIPADSVKGVAQFQDAAALGDRDASIELGDYYLDGQYLPKDVTRAIKLYESVLQSAPDYAAANLRLGNVYAEGLMGGTRDMRAAAAYYRRAAQSGDSSAERALGRAYMWGSGVPVDAQEADRWLTAAADGGSVQAVSDLAMLYGSGMANTFDPSTSFVQMVDAANKGDVAAMTNVGIAMVSGFGVPKDVDAGLDWLERASSAGSNAAMYDLYRIFHLGEGVEPDAEKADKWLKEALAAGNPSAMYVSALPLLDGTSETDKAKGIQLLRDAAALKHNQATKRLVAMKLLDAPEEDLN